MIGLLSNLAGGFQGSWAYPFAKAPSRPLRREKSEGGGYSMGLNFAMLVLPTLKSLQTATRRMNSSREWIPADVAWLISIPIAYRLFEGFK